MNVMQFAYVEYVYVCVYVCLCVCVYVCMCVYMCVYSTIFFLKKREDRLA